TVVRLEEVEDGGSVENGLRELIGVSDLVQTRGARRVKYTNELRVAQQRLAQMAVALIAQVRCRARFVVEQDRLDHRRHVSANAGAVVVEDLRDAVDIRGAGRGGDEPLD